MSDTENKHVFVSHSSRDRATVELVYAEFDRHQIPCFVSIRPGDIPVGADWDKAIADALDRSAALVLLFSQAANDSEFVVSELRMARRRKLPLFPIRLENIEASGAAELYIGAAQWLDAFNRKPKDFLAPVIEKLRPHFPLPVGNLPILPALPAILSSSLTDKVRANDVSSAGVADPSHHGRILADDDYAELQRAPSTDAPPVPGQPTIETNPLLEQKLSPVSDSIELQTDAAPLLSRSSSQLSVATTAEDVTPSPHSELNRYYDSAAWTGETESMSPVFAKFLAFLALEVLSIAGALAFGIVVKIAFDMFSRWKNSFF